MSGMARGAVSLHGKHPFQCGRRNAQPPGNRNIVFYILVHNAATDDQGMGAPQHMYFPLFLPLYGIRKGIREIFVYVILKAATFETGHGFALGHNPGAPSPFVTWQFTEGENGHRDYYWGRYGNNQAWAQKDFDRRVDDYQQLYHAAVRHTELGPEGVYRYYSTQRPVDIGTYPKPPDNQPLSIVNYDDDRRRPVADGRLMAWGELTYAKPLTEKQMEDYELKPAPGNPDRVRPSITARLKDETRGQEPPKEPGQKRNHKNHEDR